MESFKLVKVTDEEGRTSVYKVPEDFYQKIIDKYEDFQELYDQASSGDDEANDFYYGDLDGKIIGLMGCQILSIDDELWER